jgi:hypothetical protein
LGVDRLEEAMMGIRKLTIALALALACGFIAAGSASAAYLQATEYPAEVKAEREGEAHAFATDGLTVKCEGASFGAELQEAVETLEVAPTYSKCTAAGLTASVTAEGCKYRLDANASDVDLVCPSGKAMKIVAVSGTCEVQIGSQSGIQKDEFVNHAGPPKTVTVKFNAEKIKYSKTKDSGACPLSGLGEKSDGTYSGSMLAKAFHGGQVGFFQGAGALTRLCAEKSGACPEGQTYPEGTQFTYEGAAGELILIWPALPNGILECGKWTISAVSGAAQGAPFLPISPTLGAVGPCSITAGTNAGAKCTVAMSAGGGVLQAIGNQADGRWKLGLTEITVSACTPGLGPPMSRCEFREVSPALTLRGGVAETGTVEANNTFPRSKAEPTDQCPTSLVWKVSYVNNPEAGAGNVFVTN